MEQYRLLDETYANLKQIELQVTTWERNRRGEVTKVSTPLGEVSQYKYDAMGNLTSKTDEDGLETLYEYTLANKLSKVIYSDGRTVELSYNPLRQLTELRDWLGTTSIDVDALGRAEKVTDFEGKTVKYEWDKLGRRKATIYPDESKVDYSYDASGRLEQVLSKTGSTQYKYDAMGRIRERILPDNIVTQYTTDPLGRLESLTHCKNGEVLDQFKYVYDPVGNITEIDKHRNGVEADSGLFKYTYDPLGRLTQATNNQSSKQYKYDSLGNRVMSLQNGVETRHSYNARNQLIRTEENETVNEYSYDKRGNLTQILENGTIKASYVFDSANRMVEAHTNKGKAEYVYNGFLKRVKRLEEVTSTRYVLDLTRPYNDLLAIDNQRFIWGNDLLMAEGDSPFSYLHDHLGSPIRLMGETQEETLAYDEFGVPTVESTQNGNGSLNNPFGFTGYQLDDVSGLYFAQARYYEPKISRFVSEDPYWNPNNMIYGDGANNKLLPDIVAIMQSINLYTYCTSNPLRFVDIIGWYAREAAVAYAKKWYKKRNHDYYSYTTDCANFVSQCLSAGEIDMNYDWYSYKGDFNWNKFWWDPKAIFGYKFWYDWDISPAWRLAADQYDYFSNPDNGYINGDVIKINSKSEIANVANNMGVQVGDLLYFVKNGTVHHATIITKIENGEIYYAGHTNPAFNKELSKAMGKDNVYIVKIKDCA